MLSNGVNDSLLVKVEGQKYLFVSYGSIIRIFDENFHSITSFKPDFCIFKMAQSDKFLFFFGASKFYSIEIANSLKFEHFSLFDCSLRDLRGVEIINSFAFFICKGRYSFGLIVSGNIVFDHIENDSAHYSLDDYERIDDSLYLLMHKLSSSFIIKYTVVSERLITEKTQIANDGRIFNHLGKLMIINRTGLFHFQPYESIGFLGNYRLTSKLATQRGTILSFENGEVIFLFNNNKYKILGNLNFKAEKIIGFLDQTDCSKMLGDPITDNLESSLSIFLPGLFFFSSLESSCVIKININNRLDILKSFDRIENPIFFDYENIGIREKNYIYNIGYLYKDHSEETIQTQTNIKGILKLGDSIIYHFDSFSVFDMRIFDLIKNGISIDKVFYLNSDDHFYIITNSNSYDFNNTKSFPAQDQSSAATTGHCFDASNSSKSFNLSSDTLMSISPSISSHENKKFKINSSPSDKVKSNFSIQKFCFSSKISKAKYSLDYFLFYVSDKIFVYNVSKKSFYYKFVGASIHDFNIYDTDIYYIDFFDKIYQIGISDFSKTDISFDSENINQYLFYINDSFVMDEKVVSDKILACNNNLSILKDRFLILQNKLYFKNYLLYTNKHKISAAFALKNEVLIVSNKIYIVDSQSKLRYLCENSKYSIVNGHLVLFREVPAIFSFPLQTNTNIPCDFFQDKYSAQDSLKSSHPESIEARAVYMIDAPNDFSIYKTEKIDKNSIATFNSFSLIFEVLLDGRTIAYILKLGDKIIHKIIFTGYLQSCFRLVRENLFSVGLYSSSIDKTSTKIVFIEIKKRKLIVRNEFEFNNIPLFLTSNKDIICCIFENKISKFRLRRNEIKLVKTVKTSTNFDQFRLHSFLFNRDILFISNDHTDFKQINLKSGNIKIYLRQNIPFFLKQRSGFVPAIRDSTILYYKEFKLDLREKIKHIIPGKNYTIIFCENGGVHMVWI